MSPLSHSKLCGLSPLDNLSSSEFISCHLFFPLTASEKAIAILQRGAANLAQSVPWLSGELRCVQGPGSGYSIGIFTAEDRDVSRFLKIKYHNIPIEQVSSHHEPYMAVPFPANCTSPVSVLMIQANVLTNGLLLSVAANHQVIDSNGLGMVVRHLAECCRPGSDTDMNFSTLLSQHGQVREDLSIHYPTALVDNSSLEDYISYRSENMGPWKEARSKEHINRDLKGGKTAGYFLIAHEKLQALKRLINDILREEHVKTGEKKEVWPNQAPRVSSVSGDDTLLALLWMLYNRAVHPQCRTSQKSNLDYPSTTLGIGVSVRERLEPPLPKSYIGNSAILVPVRGKLQDLHNPQAGTLPSMVHSRILTPPGAASLPLSIYPLLEGLCHLACAIRSSKSRINNEVVRGLLFKILHSPPGSTTIPLDAVDLSISDTRGMKLYDADFGSDMGKPAHIRCAHSASEVAFYIFRRPGAEAPWGIHALLTDSTMRILTGDFLWEGLFYRDPFWSTERFPRSLL